MVDEDRGHAALDSTFAAVEARPTVETRPNIAEAVKEPPPESKESIWTRTWVVLSFWVIILSLGLPMWWKTTSIYRAQLPFQQMLDWDQGTVCLPNFPLEITILAPTVPCLDAKHFVQLTQHALDDLNEYAPHHLRLRLARAGETGSTALDHACQADAPENERTVGSLTIKLEPNDQRSPKLRLHAFSSDADLIYAPNQFPYQSSSNSHLSSYLANELHRLFKEEQASVAYKFAAHQTGKTGIPGTGPTTRSHGNPVGFVRSLPRDLYERISSRDTRSFKYAETYHLTFSLFSANSSPASWDVAEALDAHIKPWVEALSSISHFTINSQIQLYSKFSPSVVPFKDSITNGSLIAPTDLSAFINSAEWPLSPSIGSAGPTINFVLYVPSISQSPLTIADTNGATEWLIPQWGGVAFYNPVLDNNGALTLSNHLDSQALAPAFSTFRSQLLDLLGLPGDGADPIPLRIDSLTRLQTASLFLSAKSTLGSLARLTQSLPSIPIPLSVSRSVESANTNLLDTCRSLEVGDFHHALQHAREAEKEVEQAFFEKSMVGQVYFPDEHKIAVYLPLLGPVSFPLVLGLLKIIKYQYPVLRK